MTPFFTNYSYHPQTKWLKEREVQNPGANLYPHLRQTIYHQANQSLEKAREALGRYFDQKAKQQPDFKIGDMVILNAKNIHTKHSFKKLVPKLYSPFKILEQSGELAYKLELSECWKIYPIFHISLFEPYQTSTQPTREQLPMKPEGIDSYLE